MRHCVWKESYIYTRALSRINDFYFYQVSLGSVQDYTSPQVHSFDPGSNCECNSSSPWESALRPLSICTPPPLGAAEGSRRVPWGKWLEPGTCRFPGTVHTDPLGGDGQALCGCSAQLVCAEITRDGQRETPAACHPACHGRGAEALLAGFPDTTCPCTDPGPRAGSRWLGRQRTAARAQPRLPGRGRSVQPRPQPCSCPASSAAPGMEQGEDHSVYRKRNGVIKVSKSLFTYSFPAVMFSH